MPRLRFFADFEIDCKIIASAKRVLYAVDEQRVFGASTSFEISLLTFFGITRTIFFVDGFSFFGSKSAARMYSSPLTAGVLASTSAT